MANIWGNIFSAVLSGVASRSSERSSKEATREAGIQDRATAAFNADTDYYYNQLLRNERRGALDSGYNQFSTIRQFAPNYVGPKPLDVPDKPKPGGY